MILFHNAMLVLCVATLANAIPSNCVRKYVGEESKDSVGLPVIKVNEAQAEFHNIANSCAQIQRRLRVGSVVTACDDRYPPKLEVSSDGRRVKIVRQRANAATSATIRIKQFCG